jgi:hypothetical protein
MPGRGTLALTGVGRRRSVGAGLALGVAHDGWDLALDHWAPYDERLGYERGEHDTEDVAAESRRRGSQVEVVPADLAVMRSGWWATWARGVREWLRRRDSGLQRVSHSWLARSSRALPICWPIVSPHPGWSGLGRASAVASRGATSVCALAVLLCSLRSSAAVPRSFLALRRKRPMMPW